MLKPTDPNATAGSDYRESDNFTINRCVLG